MTDDELICHFDEQEVAFSNVIPSKILAIQVDPPIILREDVQDIALKTWNNGGSTPLFYDEEVLEEDTTTESLNIAAEISTAIRSKIGGSAAGFSAEVEAQVSAKLGITHNTQTQVHHSNKETIKVEVPAFKSVSLTQKHSETDFKQRVITTCQIDANVRLFNNGLEKWTKKLDSLRQLELYFKGGGGGSGDNVQALDDWMSQRLFKAFELPYDRTQFTIDRDRLYRNAKTSEVDRSETSL
ncbi:MAG: hypothetical protein OXE50_16570 [Chloroflexi bacterium]|nr:hypothetical protein [Chloroflexota bacterium]